MSNGGRLTTEELEHLIQQLSGHPDYRVVRRLAPKTHYAQPDGSPVAKGIIIDTETTGMRPRQDKIIELGMVAFEFDPQSGQAFRILESYNALEDPGMPIPPESTDIHGITDAMIAGKKIDDATVTRLADGALIVIAHNSGLTGPSLNCASRFLRYSHGAARMSRWIEKTRDLPPKSSNTSRIGLDSFTKRTGPRPIVWLPGSAPMHVTPVRSQAAQDHP